MKTGSSGLASGGWGDEPIDGARLGQELSPRDEASPRQLFHGPAVWFHDVYESLCDDDWLAGEHKNTSFVRQLREPSSRPARRTQQRFRDELPYLLKQRELSARELARRIGINQSYLAFVLGGRSAPSRKLLESAGRCPRASARVAVDRASVATNREADPRRWGSAVRTLSRDQIAAGRAAPRACPR